MGVSQRLGPLGASSYTTKVNSLVCLLLLVLLSLLSVHLRDPAIIHQHAQQPISVQQENFTTKLRYLQEILDILDHLVDLEVRDHPKDCT